ncbi:MAG: FAD-binding protein [Microscillaceae bacterium]|nr:FAD-binding protein [Microscillaceae bacterium]MDW8461901.1 FAD-linked oxidase C-terminal domain-containing protein [Cytophagales bacterium]
MLKINRKDLTTAFQTLQKKLEGEFYFDEVMRTLYATDASVYREMPLAVCLPKNDTDIQTLIRFANEYNVPLIPRSAGTSLAGQVVGKGIIVDISKYFKKIFEVNPEQRYVHLQVGVVRDELNLFLKNYNLVFGPETATANRAIIGGMIGNNSCGANSIVYGSTREHVLELKGFLSNGEYVTFKALNENELAEKLQAPSLEGKIYREIFNILQNPENQAEIRKEFPKPNIPRRNTGYALDLLLETAPFTQGKEAFNMCKLITGSEGTLFFITEAKLRLSEPIPPHRCLVACHFQSIYESLQGNLIALQFQPTACELIDHFILECTKNNLEHQKNRFFVQGEPQAILIVEIARHTAEECDKIAQELIKSLQEHQLGYAFPVIQREDMGKVWALRKAGLGLLASMKGDAKPAEVIEDTAVAVEDLPAYIAEMNQMLQSLDTQTVHYAHAGTGEIHLKPILNLKTAEGHRKFREIAYQTAKIVKKYQGSLSGEHGDGRLRGEFIPFMVGEKNYALLKEVKRIFDEKGIFNPNKIVDTPKMDESMRHEPHHQHKERKTILDFSSTGGIERLAEQCSGSGDCRKTELIGGTMCPSFMATRNEKETTRARANILREFYTRQDNPHEQPPLTEEQVLEVLDLCLSCKGCKAECPSNIDMAKMKAEFLQSYYDKKPVPFRTRLIASYTKSNQLASFVPALYNFVITNKWTSSLFKRIVGFAQKRSLPTLQRTTLQKWYRKNARKQLINKPLKGKVYLFADEFTNFNDTHIGIQAIQLLNALGYEVIIPQHVESGRTYLSKGLVRKAQTIAKQNVALLHSLVSAEMPLIGIEPSAILTFRDEYLDLMDTQLLKEKAQQLAQNCLLIDEFLAKEIDKGNITSSQFTQEKRLIKLHGHCHQKALASLVPLKKVLSLPTNYEVHLIPSGCCGMAGSFGYEKEHYEISMQIGELVLFPKIRESAPEVLICANGTSCRHQIKDGTHKTALHVVEILWQAFNNRN